MGGDVGPEAMWGHKVKGDEQMGGDVGMGGDRMGGDRREAVQRCATMRV